MDLRRIAKRKLPSPVFDYLDGGADDELSLARNTDAFNDYEFLPTQLSDISNLDLKTTLFGQPMDWPVMISPTGASKLFHADGEPAVIRAADKFGMIYSLSTLGTTTIEDTAEVGTCPKVYQIYVFKDRGLTEDFIARCIEHQYTALCLTVDTVVAGNRERDSVSGFGVPPKFRWHSALSFAMHPGWLARALLRKDLEMVNITSNEHAARHVNSGIIEYINSQFERSLAWKDVEWLASRWNGPLIIKGVQTVEDCRKAADCGATAVMLSNHGGRQLESTPAPIDCVADVADALRDRLEIICDGGVRRGTHVVKALSMGANACSIGRGYLYGLAAGGQAGVERALGLLRSEVERTMILLGCDSVGKLSGAYTKRRGERRM